MMTAIYDDDDDEFIFLSEIFLANREEERLVSFGREMRERENVWCIGLQWRYKEIDHSLK